MSAQLLDGKVLAGILKENLKREIDGLKARTGSVPVVVSILTGEDPSALSYAESQKKTAESLGIDYRLKKLPASVSQDEMLGVIRDLNNDNSVHAVLINKPLPSQIEYGVVANAIAEGKDIEGLNVANIGKMFFGKRQLFPCTAAAVMEHLRFARIPLRGKEAVIIGRSEIVGKPLILLLLAENATVTVCHSATDASKLIEHLRRADVVVAAVGKPGFVKGEWIKPGATVIDVGINRVEGRIVGDVDFASVSQVAGAITPVPGGVGPVTSVVLMKNAVEAFKKHFNQ
ncbi:MAG: bifunctional 5,10-methylenetetrahydrofolate dehydrogenase/5,10-methenyltetrahydrofolate cyclohydrolase [Candidatus Omnitrophica bacterium]|nr:bifunctional 5,10-methylenetetrahydrofolate dehydrogenase/5,10-methenyltetrahydrofolate cyclohydrolase [Candidatus Omnitrophota bacterium]